MADLAEEGPMILIVDDAHWADASSIRFLEFLSRRLDSLAISVVISARPEEPDAAAVVSRLLADPLAERIQPSPLSPAATTQVVRAALGERADDLFCEACWEATGGNPFLLCELTGDLVRSGAEPIGAGAAGVRDIGPRPVSRAVLLRLRRLSPEAEALAQTLAILGEGADPRCVAALTTLQPPVVAEAAADLPAVGILAGGDVLRFVQEAARVG